MTIQLIAVDMDGTFLDAQSQFNQVRFQTLLDRFTAQGGQFTVASGNQYQHLLKKFENITGNIDYIAENGAVVKSHGQFLTKAVIDPAVWRMIVRDCQANPHFEGALLSLSGEHGAYMPSGRPLIERRGMRNFYENVQDVDDLEAVDDNIYKIAFSFPDRDSKVEEAYLNRKYAGEARATSSGRGGIDVILPNISKAVGIRQVQQQWKIPTENTMAFGDGGNDVEMLKAVRYGVVMKNAPAEVKAVTHYETLDDNRHEGVLNTMEAVLNGQLPKSKI